MSMDYPDRKGQHLKAVDQNDFSRLYRTLKYFTSAQRESFFLPILSLQDIGFSQNASLESGDFALRVFEIMCIQLGKTSTAEGSIERIERSLALNATRGGDTPSKEKSALGGKKKAEMGRKKTLRLLFGEGLPVKPSKPYYHRCRVQVAISKKILDLSISISELEPSVVGDERLPIFVKVEIPDNPKFRVSLFVKTEFDFFVLKEFVDFSPPSTAALELMFEKAVEFGIIEV
ncbi:hypothetical protein RCL1_003384 [Eukaryota sp. TZLM3-RCL]